MFAVQGLLLAILGTLAVAVPQVASVAIAAFVGWLLFLAGIFRAAVLIRMPHAPGYLAALLMAILWRGMNAGETASVGHDCQRKWLWVAN